MRRPAPWSEEFLLPGQRFVGLARLRVQRGANARGELGAALDRRGRILRRQVPGPQLVGRVLELGYELLELRCHGRVTSVRLTVPRMPLTNFGASAAQSSFAASIASSMATSSGTSVRYSISYSAVRRMLRSSGAIRSSVQPSA